MKENLEEDSLLTFLLKTKKGNKGLIILSVSSPSKTTDFKTTIK
jgi:hypothetical protein